LKFFAPEGRQVAPMGVKNGMEWVPNFNPIGANIRVYGPKTENFATFYKILEYLRPIRATCRPFGAKNLKMSL